MRCLIVCTANVCRSPMAAALLEQQCTRRGLTVDVRSAGTHVGSVGVDPEMLTTMARRGIDLSAHQPRLLVRELLAEDGHDLILAMTREHLRTVATSGPAVITRTFTAKELARRVVGLRPTANDGGVAPSVAGWLAAAGEGRSLRNLMGAGHEDDVDDPYSLSLARHMQTAEEIDELMSTIAESLAMWTG